MAGAAARASMRAREGKMNKAADLDFVGGMTRHPQRISAAQKALRNKEKLKQLFRKHDVDQSRRLDHGQLQNLLADYAGKKVSHDDTTFALRMADNGNVDGEIDMDEICAAIAAWSVLDEGQDFWNTKFDSFNTDMNGGLDKEQLGAFMRELNGKGGEVTPEEVEWLHGRADLDKNGLVDKQEMRVAVAIWYTRVNFSKTDDRSRAKHSASCCCGGSAPVIVK
jgi:Ca2+-binding EF-hand superfamily protein